jgi:integrase
MARYSISIKPYKSALRPHLKWVLNVWHPSGKRERLFFATKTEAEREKDLKRVEVENIGLRALDISDRLRQEALDAQEMLNPYQVTIREVVLEYVKRRGAQSAIIDDLAQGYIASRSKNECSKRHLTSLRCLYKRFTDAFTGQRACDIGPEAIEAWFDGLRVSPITVNSYRTLLHALFGYAVKKRLCPENPVSFIDRRTVKGGKVEILTPLQLRDLLDASSGDVLATVAIGAFAGIRPEEIARLTWEEIDLEEGLINVLAAKSKTAKERYVKILPVLSSWLLPLVGRGGIQQPNFRRRFEEAKSKAGFLTREGAGKGSGLVEWPHDGLRHSFASYHLAQFQDAPALALQLGHESTSLIFSNYRHRVKPRDAEEYFGLRPTQFRGTQASKKPKEKHAH